MLVDGQDHYGEVVTAKGVVSGVPCSGLEGEVQSIKNQCCNRSLIMALHATIMSQLILRRQNLNRQPPSGLPYPPHIIIRQ